MPQKKISITYSDSLPFRHWSLYIRHGKNDFELFELNGSTGNYHYNTGRTGNPQQTSSYLETVQLGSVPSNDIHLIRTLASEQEIRRHWNWNCQNWIVNLVFELQNQGILSVPDETIEKLERDRQSLEDGFDPDRPERIPTPE